MASVNRIDININNALEALNALTLDELKAIIPFIGYHCQKKLEAFMPSKPAAEEAKKILAGLVGESSNMDKKKTKSIIKGFKGTMRPLNSFIAYRCYYSTIFTSRAQKNISGFLNVMWKNDPFKNAWASIAFAYTKVRDYKGKELAPLDLFLSNVCPNIGIISPDYYLEAMGWIVHESGNDLRLIGPSVTNYDHLSVINDNTFVDAHTLIGLASMTGYLGFDEVDAILVHHTDETNYKGGSIEDIPEYRVPANIERPHLVEWDSMPQEMVDASLKTTEDMFAFMEMEFNPNKANFQSDNISFEDYNKCFVPFNLHDERNDFNDYYLGANGAGVENNIGAVTPPSADRVYVPGLFDPVPDLLRSA